MNKYNMIRVTAGVLIACALHGRAQIASNTITGTQPSLDNPFTSGQVIDANISASGIGMGAGLTANAGSNRYNASNWDTSGLNNTDYFEWTLTPNTGYAMDFTSLTGNWQRSSTGPTTYVLRSSLDGFTADITTGTVVNGTSAFSLSLTDPEFDAVASGITFRLYAYGGTSTAGTFSINDYAFNGAVSPYVPPAGDLLWLSGVGGSGDWTNSPSDTNWSGGAWDSSFRAVFQGTGGTVNVVGTIEAASGMFFDANGYEISGDTLDLGGAVNVAAGVTSTLSVKITGDDGFTKSGNGTVILSSLDNDFTGTVSLNSGVLQISSDANLGNSDNDLSFSGGALKVIDDLTLGGGRDVLGGARFDVAGGKTLTIDGNINAGFTLLNTGTISVTSIATISELNFSSAGTFIAATGAFLTGNVSSTHSDGTAVLSGYFDLGSGTRVFTIADGSSAVDLELAGTLAGSAYVQKLGLGTLRVTADTSSEFLGGFRIGSAGTGNGGKVILASGASLGASQLQFNWGTLEAESDMEFGVGISIGGREATRAVFQGGNMTFNGDSALFEGAGQQSRIDVNNVTTLNGALVQNTGTTFVGTGLTVGGTGTLVLNGDGSGQTRTTTVTDTATLVINNNYGASVEVTASAKLKGIGTIAGLIEVYGIHSVGNSAGIQTAEAGVSYLSGAAFEWELVADSDATPGTDFDQLIVSGGAIGIESGVTMDLLFNSVGSTVDWTDSFWDTDHSWTIVGNTGGGLLTGQFGLNASSEWFDANGVLLSAIDPDADFVLSAVNGDIILTYYAVPIPEPSTLVFLGLAGVGLFAVRRRARVANFL